MDEMMVILIALAVIIVVFLLLREFWTWYWKINQLIKGQDETNRLLQKIVDNQVIKESKLDTNLDEFKGFSQDIKNLLVDPNVNVIVRDSNSEELCTFNGKDWNNIIINDPEQKRYLFIKVQ
jgi:hypothetical protein